MGRWVRFATVLAISLILSACARMVPGLTEATQTATETLPAAPAAAAATATAAASAASPAPAPTSLPTATAGPTQPVAPNPTPAGAWIQAKPDAGTPGQTIQVEGFLPGGLTQTDLASQDYITHADICWNGCANGLMESVEVTWSRTETGRFSLPFTVPPIPWLAADGLHLMEAGDYTLGLVHLDPAVSDCKPSGECTVTPVASANFHLTQSAAHPTCEGQTCGSLSVSPASAAPGERVEVSGWAPLLKLIGTPFGFDLALVTSQGTPTNQDVITFPVTQAMDGSISGSFQMPQMQYNGKPLAPGTYRLALDAGGFTATKGSPPVLINFSTIQVSAAPQWTQIKHPVPLWISPSTDLEGEHLETDPLHPNRLAYCGGGKIMVSDDAGQTWSAVPNEAVGQLSPDSQVAIDEQPPSCLSVTLDSAHPDSFYAVFAAVRKDYGAPPIYYAGAFSSDRGKTWQIAPVPSVLTSQQLTSGNFGGFWTNGKVVQALYYGEPTPQGQLGPLLAKQTADGGATWSEAGLACPASGPCLRWGAAPTQGGGMGAPMPQAVLSSENGGQAWQDTDQSIELRMTEPHELAALTDSQAVLISGAENYPLRYTPDGGKTWQALALPPLPMPNPGYPLGYPGLQMLPDGSLMTMLPDTGQWLRLAPSAQDWCPTGLVFTDQVPKLLTVAGDRVWWLSPQDLQAKSEPVSALRCLK